MEHAHSITNIAEIIPRSFLLQRKIGGKAASFITPEMVQIAEEILETFKAPLKDEVKSRLKSISKLARHRKDNIRDEVWRHAHEVRGIAANAGYVSLGKIANLICNYLDGTPSEFKPDPNLLTTVAVASLFTMQNEGKISEVGEELVRDCEIAINLQMANEGRAH